MSEKENKSIEVYNLTTPGDMENLFDKDKKQLESEVCEKKIIENNNKDKNKLEQKDEKDIEKEKKENTPFSKLALFDELGLAERAKVNPLKILHRKLEYGGTMGGISFIGISNWTLDAAKINRALKLSVTNLEN